MKVPAIAAAAAVALLAGCGTTGATRTQNAGASNAPASCHSQYETWKHGAAETMFKQQLQPALRTVQAAASSMDIPKLNSALQNAGNMAQQLTAYPLPHCADPGGFWGKMLGYIKAAGDNAGTSSGLAGLLAAMAPLEHVKPVLNQLSAELKLTAGVA